MIKVKIIKAQVMMKFQMRSKLKYILLKQFNNISKTNIPQLFTYLYYSIQNIDDQTENNDGNDDNDNDDYLDGNNTITQSQTDIELDSTVHDISDKGNNKKF